MDVAMEPKRRGRPPKNPDDAPDYNANLPTFGMPSEHKAPSLDLMDMQEAPRDGKPLMLYGPDTEECESVWRSTRYFHFGVWKVTGFWAVRNSGGVKVPFEPIGWKAL